MDGNKCERCSTTMSPLDPWTRLCGGRAATLCTGCKNDWNDFIKDSPAWANVFQANVEERFVEALAAAGTPVSRKQIERALEMDRAAKTEIYKLSGEWMKIKPERTMICQQD